MAIILVCVLTRVASERRNVKIINAPSGTQQNPYLLSDEEEKKTLKRHADNKQKLRVPRRPPWTKGMTTAQLDRHEKDAFLDWRRGLAQYVQIAANSARTYSLHSDSRRRIIFC